MRTSAVNANLLSLNLITSSSSLAKVFIPFASIAFKLFPPGVELDPLNTILTGVDMEEALNTTVQGIKYPGPADESIISLMSSGRSS